MDTIKLLLIASNPDDALAERCGYVLQAADAHLELAKLALNTKDLLGLRDLTGLALQYARAARKLAECDGELYVYRVAYDEAGALLAQLEKSNPNAV